MKDYPAVFQLADANPANTPIGLVAALSAIAANDSAEVQKFTSRLTLDDETILTLIEKDAASNRWIVPGNIYQAAGAIDDADKKTRVARVLSLKQVASGNMAAPAPASMAGIPDRLMSARTALESLEGEAN